MGAGDVVRGVRKGRARANDVLDCAYKLPGGSQRISGAKIHISPQKCAKIPPKIAQRKTGAGVGDATVSYCDVIPRLPPGDPRGERSLRPLYYDGPMDPGTLGIAGKLLRMINCNEG